MTSEARINQPLTLPALIAAFSLAAIGSSPAQTFATLHRFAGGSEGANPYASLNLSANTLYGTAYQGGSSGRGTVFKFSTDGTGFTTLHSFTGGTDGANLHARLVLSGTTLKPRDATKPRNASCRPAF